eukprot:5787958-Pleurochrysis_carterae.AAC.1
MPAKTGSPFQPKPAAPSRQNRVALRQHRVSPASAQSQPTLAPCTAQRAVHIRRNTANGNAVRRESRKGRGKHHYQKAACTSER